MDNFKKFYIERERIPLLKKWTYFETAATGAIPDYVHDGVSKYQEDRFLKGGDSDWDGKNTFDMVEDSKTHLANMFNCDASDIAFGENTSQMFNILTSGIDMKSKDNVIMTDTTFISMAHAWNLKHYNDGIEIKFVKSDDGIINIEDIFSQTDENTKVISLTHVESTTGFRHDLAKIGEYCKEKNILLAADVAQSAGIMPIDVKAMNISFLAGNNYKWMMNYCGVGYAYISPKLQQTLICRGAGWRSCSGKLELSKDRLKLKESAGRYEYGYPNAPGIYGIGKVAQKYTELKSADIEEYVLDIVEYIHIAANKISGVKIRSDFKKKNRSNIVILTVDDSYNISTEILREENVFLNVLDGEMYNSRYYMRLGIHYYNNKADVDRLFQVICKTKKSEENNYDY